IDAKSEVSEGNPRPHRVSVERRRVDRQRPVALRNRQAGGVAVVQCGMVERSWSARAVVLLESSYESHFVEAKRSRKLGQRFRGCAWKHRWDETAYRLGIDDRIGDLAR